QSIADVDERITRRRLDDAEALQVPDVEDHVEARSGCVACGRHAQSLKSLRLDLAWDADEQLLPAKGLADPVIVTVDEERLLEVLVLVGRHRRGVEPVQLGEEGEDEAAAHVDGKGSPDAGAGGRQGQRRSTK